MGDYFWSQQSKGERSRYIELLKIIGSLSYLFSDSPNPYLYYRAHENLFCEVFKARNLSRGDISFDAVKGKFGIGLKTFLQNNGLTFQKIAEFNADSDLFRGIVKEEDIVYKVAELRNKRIQMTQNATNTNQNIYHIITRDKGRMNIVETSMDLIDIDSIQIPKMQSKNTIKFSDKYSDYSFSRSKNTLLKRFDTRQNQMIKQFPVIILKNPFELLTQFKESSKEILEPHERQESIILPLYSTRYGEVSKRSGLNQWNARGRRRHPDEVYIPIPLWIHTSFPSFFEFSKNYYSGKSAKDSPSFNVELPSGEIMSCKVAQSGGKALMSNPNKLLGHWILRQVLQVPTNTLVTKKLLDEIGIDSVKLTKKNNEYYILDFMESRSFEEFEENNLNCNSK